METQISVYNVVWVDDEIDTLLAPMETKRILKRNSIEIIKARTSLEFRDIMEKRYDSIDAVITDANFSKFLTSNVDERDLSGFEDIKSCIEKYNVKRDIPFYLYSGRGEYLAERYEFAGMEYFQENGRNFSKGELPQLLERLRADVEHINSASFRVRKKYAKELAAASLIPENEEALFTALLYEYSEDWKNTEDYFNPQRKIVERIFVESKKRGIIPSGLTQLNEFSSFLNNRHPLFRISGDNVIMEKPLAHSLEFFLNITQDGSHGDGDLKLSVDKYVREKRNINLFLTILYITMDLCLWYAEVASKPREDNLLKWEIKEDCKFEYKGEIRFENGQFVCGNYLLQGRDYEVGRTIGIKSSLDNKYPFTYKVGDSEIIVDKFTSPKFIIYLGL